MDAVKFLEEVKRMCESYEECEACPANADGFDDCRIDYIHDIGAENAVNIVEKWAKEHPKKRHGRVCFWSSGQMLNLIATVLL